MDKSPIQQAIAFWKEREKESPTEQMRIAAQLFLEYLTSLLPKEKGFVGMVWDASAERATNVFTQTFHPEHFPDKIDFLNQLYLGK